MNHNGNANKMVSDTPRTDAAYFKPRATMYDLAGEMKRMERELTAANQRIKRLEEAGDTMASEYRQICYDPYDDQQIDNWIKAKGEKP